MGVPDEVLTLAGGWLIRDPTDLSAGASPNYGGTVLGTVQSVALIPTYRVEPIISEETGEDADGIYMGQEGVLTVILRNYDADGLSAIFPGVSPGIDGPVLDYPGGVPVGSLWSDQGMVLYMAAKRPDHPGLMLYNALPRPDAERINFGAYDDWSVLATWVGIRDAGNRVGRMAPHADQVL